MHKDEHQIIKAGPTDLAPKSLTLHNVFRQPIKCATFYAYNPLGRPELGTLGQAFDPVALAPPARLFICFDTGAS
jgi:hypothetical protein